MKRLTNLALLEVGHEAVINEINLTGAILKRVYDLGFLPEVKVRCVLKAPSKSPIAFHIKGTTVALRKKDAQKILCTVSDGGKYL